MEGKGLAGSFYHMNDVNVYQSEGGLRTEWVHFAWDCVHILLLYNGAI